MKGRSQQKGQDRLKKYVQIELHQPLLQVNEEVFEELAVKQERERSSEEDEEEERIQKELEQLKRQIKDRQRVRRENKKVFVGTGFGFDITEFFKFKKKKQLQSGGDAKSIFQQISGGNLAIFILVYSVINSAMIPYWMTYIDANKFVKISWRFLLQTFMGIPFVLHERRNAHPQALDKYSLRYIFELEHFKKACFSAFATSFWFSIILTTFQWTYISHALFLGAMTNFFLSLDRSARGNGHDFEYGGQVLIFIGIFLILTDTWTLRVDNVNPRAYQFLNCLYLTRTQVQRIAGDLIALAVSYCMSKFSVYNSDLKNHYPPYLSMMLVNSLVCINMTFCAYFFNGVTFNFDGTFGLFSLFSQKNFSGVFYMSIILCLGLVISFLLISQLFPNPIVPSLAMTFQPGISTLVLEMAGIQIMPGPFAFIGYIFIIPGNFLTLIGQWIFQREHKKEEIEEKKRLTILINKQYSLRSKRLISNRNIEMVALNR